MLLTEPKLAKMHDPRYNDFFLDPDATYTPWDKAPPVIVTCPTELTSLCHYKSREDLDRIDEYLIRLMFNVRVDCDALNLVLKVRYVMFPDYVTKDVEALIEARKKVGTVFVSSRRPRR
jgi:hypothetical protein